VKTEELALNTNDLVPGESFEAAINTYLKTLETDPNSLEARFNLAIIYKKHNNLNLTLKIAKEAASCIATKSSIDDINNLGILLVELQEYNLAIKCFNKALDIESNNYAVLLNAGIVSKKIKDFATAVTYFSKALSIHETASTLTNLGEMLLYSERLEEAYKYIKKSLELEPNSAQSLTIFGNISFSFGNIKEAQEQFLKAIDLKPDYVSAYISLAEAKKFSNEDNSIISKLEQLVVAPGLNTDELMTAYFALGKMLSDCKHYDQAFNYYHKANTIKQAGNNFNIAEFESNIKRNQAVYNKELLKKKTIGNPSKAPIFIVGMPRSGTTMTEQIITSHSLAKGVGEVTYIENLASQIAPRTTPHNLFGLTPYPECVPYMKKDEIQNIANKYLAEISQATDKPYKIVNKNPMNFGHIGFIHLLFPNATIIHCKRHPLDICLSMYFHNFLFVNFSYDFSIMAQYYKIYNQTMKYWHQQITNTIYDSYYEELLFDQEARSKALIAKCGLKWEDQCLEFHKNKQVIYTASKWQVRQKLYTDSMYRWKNYEKHLGLLKDALADEIAEYETELNRRLNR
jgi:Tfp pilus assembly protein PilF